MPRDDLLPLRLQFETLLLEHQLDLEAALRKALRLWLPGARKAVGQEEEVVLLAAGLPDPAQIAGTTAVWTDGVERNVRPAVGAIFQVAVEEAIGSQLDVEFVPVEAMRDAYWSVVQNRIKSLPDAVYRQMVSVMRTMQTEGASLTRIGRALDAVLSTAGLQAEVAGIARTESTGAWNAGTWNAWQYADDLLGMEHEKVWIATHDLRTRDTHRRADEQRVPLNSPFIVGGFPLQFPGSPGGPASEVVNCRCAMVLLEVGQELPDVRPPWPVAASGPIVIGRSKPAARPTTIIDRAVFHLPGEHDQRTHGRRLAGLDGPVADAAAMWHQDLEPVASLIETIQSGQVGEAKLIGGGVQGKVYRVAFGNGKTAIRKDFVERTDAGLDLREAAAAETLGSMLGVVLGAPVPIAVRTGESEVWIEDVPGRTLADIRQDPPPGWPGINEFEDALIESDEGLRLGLLNLLTMNFDHVSNANVMIKPDGKLVGIDHGASWNASTMAHALKRGAPEQPVAGDLVSPFGRQYLTDIGSRWTKNKLHPDDVEWLRARIGELENDFDAAGRHDWWQFARDRLEALAPHAAGTRRLFGGQTAAGAEFHRKGRHDQKRHGWRARQPMARSYFVAAVEAGWTYDDDDTNLARGGSVSVRRITLSDGTRAVRKEFHPASGDDAARQEVHASELGEAIGAPVPHAVLDGRAAIIEWIDGETGGSAGRLVTPPQNPLMVANDVNLEGLNQTDALRLGLLDLLMRNPDRNAGNWIEAEGGHVVGIDHAMKLEGGAIKPGRPNRLEYEADPFAVMWVQAGGEFAPGVITEADAEWLMRQVPAELTGWPEDDATFAAARLQAIVEVQRQGGWSTGPDRFGLSSTTAAGWAAVDAQSGTTDHPDRAANEAHGRADRAGLDEPGLPEEPALFHLPGEHEQKTHGSRASLVSLASMMDTNTLQTDREQMARMVVSGLHGDKFADVDVADYDEDDQRLDLAGPIRTTEGQTVGRWRCTVVTDDDGARSLDHPGVTIDRDAQGSGFATEWTTELFRWAQENDVQYAEIVANMDVGGYAWAVRGWEWGDETQARRIGEKFVDAMRDLPEGELDSELLAALDDIEKRFDLSPFDPRFPTPRELALYARKPGQGGRDAMWWGKQFMIRQRWIAVMRLQP
jgi:hypothetical protein